MKKSDLLKPGDERLEQIVTLCREIIQREHTITMLHGQTLKEANGWKCEVLLQGQSLSRVKAMLTFGEWGRWLQNNCPLISAKTAQRYMWVANNADRPGMDEATSLRTALALRERGTAVVPREPKRFTPANESTERVARVRAILVKQKEDVAGWPPECVEKILVDLDASAGVFGYHLVGGASSASP